MEQNPRQVNEPNHAVVRPSTIRIVGRPGGILASCQSFGPKAAGQPHVGRRLHAIACHRETVHRKPPFSVHGRKHSCWGPESRSGMWPGCPRGFLEHIGKSIRGKLAIGETKKGLAIAGQPSQSSDKPSCEIVSQLITERTSSLARRAHPMNEYPVHPRRRTSYGLSKPRYRCRPSE